jgi:flagellar hook-basal body complex protein FliE
MTNALPGLDAAGATRAYQSIESGIRSDTPNAGGSFSDLVGRALDNAVSTAQTAETQSLAAMSGQGDLTSVVTAVSRAQLALQTTVAVRDRVLQAYQGIIKMSI